jgi:hypothetical protein
VRLLPAVAAAALIWVLVFVVVLGVTGCQPDTGRRYCQTPQHGEACGPSPTVHPSP